MDLVIKARFRDHIEDECNFISSKP
uniref:Uncharacterized protein n=1 Tax=Lepeophtheirus salmonis TaxID=72036 RepID=A0A0K2TYE2_LEPSM